MSCGLRGNGAWKEKAWVGGIQGQSEENNTLVVRCSRI